MFQLQGTLACALESQLNLLQQILAGVGTSFRCQGTLTQYVDEPPGLWEQAVNRHLLLLRNCMQVRIWNSPLSCGAGLPRSSVCFRNRLQTQYT